MLVITIYDFFLHFITKASKLESGFYGFLGLPPKEKGPVVENGRPLYGYT